MSTTVDTSAPMPPRHGAGRPGFRALWGRARPHRRTIFLAIALGFVGIAVDLAQPLAARTVINAVSDDGSLRNAVLILVGLVVVGAVIGAMHYFLLERTAEGIARDARLSLAGRILRLRLPDVQRFARGDLLSRMSSDTTLLRSATTTGIAGGVNGVLSLVGSLILMAWIDWRLLLVTLTVLIVVLLGVAVIGPRIGAATRRGQEAMGAIAATLERALTAVRTVKANGAEVREHDAIRASADAAYGHGLSVARFTATSSVLAGVGLQVSFLAVLGVGGARVADGALDVGSFIAFLLYLFYLAGPLTELTLATTQLQAGLAAVGRLDEIDALPVEDVSSHDVTTQTTGPPAIAFENVTFRYAPDLPAVLEAVTLELPAGGQTAIVGQSGVGKTTLFGLLERFFVPDTGRVLLDGIDISEVPLGELRAQIGYVEQDAPLVGGTLRDNLVYGAPSASDEQITKVLRLTQLDGMVAHLPNGINSSLGDNGDALSGGQRQRVAIARALMRAPRLLLLDEATSQLDAINEIALRTTIRQVAESCTVVVIAHRRATVAAADQVVVLHDGRVRAVGSHDALVATDAHYRELVASELIGTTLH